MTKLAQEKSSLDGIIGLYQDYKAAVKSLEDTQSMLNEKLDAEAAINVLGGRLELVWADDECVYMTGPAATVFEGEWSLEE